MLQAHCMWINTALAAFEGIQWHLQGSTVGILNHGTMFVCVQYNAGYLGAYLGWVLCSLRGVSTIFYCVLRYLCNTIYLDVCSVRRRRVFISCDVEVYWVYYMKDAKRLHCSWMCIWELEKCIIWGGNKGECIVFGVCIWEPVERDDLTWQFPPGSAATLPNLHSCPSQPLQLNVERKNNTFRP